MNLAYAHAVVGGFGGGEIPFQRPQRGVPIDRVLERRALERGRLLRHVRDTPARRIVHLALVGVQLAAQERETSAT
jgi:hypothetical protein